MAYYLVRARPKVELMAELGEKLREQAFVGLQPFGRALSEGLNGARWESPDVVVWEEEDYCSPPLAMERAAVLDLYFDDIRVERVQRASGWQRIARLPLVFAK